MQIDRRFSQAFIKVIFVGASDVIIHYYTKIYKKIKGENDL